MLSWKDVMIAQEHSKDLLREAEEARLIKQLGGDEETGLWQKVRSFFTVSEESKPTNEAVYSCSVDAAS
jgi:hypothetical protein